MKKVLIILGILMFLTLVLISCASTYYLVDDVLPFEYFQGLRKGNERLVSFAPVLAPNHSTSLLFIITNPDDIQSAFDSMSNTNYASYNDIKKLLNDFSPVFIYSSQQQYGNGLAIFSIPENIENFFYVYLNFNNNDIFSANLKTENNYGIIPYPTNSDYIFIGFTEKNNELDVYAATSYSELKSFYEKTKGFYGYYLSKKKKQIGFNEITYNIRSSYTQERNRQWKAEGRNMKTGLFDEPYSGRSFSELSELEAFKQTEEYRNAVANYSAWKNKYDSEQNRISAENRAIQNRNNIAKNNMENKAQRWLYEIKIKGLEERRLPANGLYEEKFLRGGTLIQAQIVAILLVNNQEYARQTFSCPIEQLLINTVGDYNPIIRY